MKPPLPVTGNPVDLGVELAGNNKEVCVQCVYAHCFVFSLRHPAFKVFGTGDISCLLKFTSVDAEIPVGRVEELLYWLRHLEQTKRIPVLPVYLDSPMAAGALQFYSQRITELDSGLKPAERDVCVFGTGRMTIVDSAPESADLAASQAAAKSSFSERKPYPGWIACAPLMSAADMIAGMFR